MSKLPIKVKIYCLKDPDSGEIRYVGKTIQTLNSRLASHYCRKRNYKQKNAYNHTEAWVHGLREVNKKPIIDLLEEVSLDGWEEVEKNYIRRFREAGYNLTNHSDGGDKCNFGARWTIKDKSTMASRIVARSIPCIVLDIISYKVNEFDSLVKASEFLGISSASNANKKKHIVSKRWLVLTKPEFDNFKKMINEC